MIRRATENDIPRLTALLFQVQKVHSDGRPDIFRAGERKYTDAELSEILKDDERPVFVYEEDGTVQGYAFCIFQRTEEGTQLHRRVTLYIDDLCVDAVCRGKGIGRVLYQHVLETAKNTGCDSVTLNVWELNNGARSFYEKMGLTPLKTVMEQRL